MQNRLKIALVVAVFFGLIAAYGIFNFLNQTAKRKRVFVRQIKILSWRGKIFLRVRLLNDEAIKKGVVKTMPWPKASVPAGAFSSSQQVIGKVNRVKILANEPILESRLAGEGAG